MTSLLKNLFEPHHRETEWDLLWFKFVELYIVYRAIWYAWTWGIYIMHIGGVVLPLGLANYLDISVLFRNGLSLANAGVITLGMIVGFMRWNRWAYAVALAGLHLQYAARFSLGEISHGSNYLGLAVLALAIAIASFGRPAERRRFTYGFLLFLYGLGYFTAAITKLVVSGAGWIQGRHLQMWIAERTIDVISNWGSISMTELQRLVMENEILGTLMLSFGLGVELLAILLWWRRTRAAAAVLIILLHFGIVWLMQISFSSNLVLVFLIGFPWARWFGRLGATSKIGNWKVGRAAIRYA